MTQLDLTEERWQAILTNDSQADDQFFYAVKTTHIFCKPSCASRPPKRENVAVYSDELGPLEAGYRPCKRCQPLGKAISLDAWIADIKNYLQLNYQRKVTLEKIANDIHSSPYYLHHVFKAQTGLTPLDYLTSLRINKAKELLKTTSYSIAIIARYVGISNPPYFSVVFKKITKETPSHYRKKHET